MYLQICLYGSWYSEHTVEKKKLLLIGLTPQYGTKYTKIVFQRKCMHRSLAIIYKTVTTMASNITGTEKTVASL